MVIGPAHALRHGLVGAELDCKADGSRRLLKRNLLDRAAAVDATTLHEDSIIYRENKRALVGVAHSFRMSNAVFKYQMSNASKYSSNRKLLTNTLFCTRHLDCFPMLAHVNTQCIRIGSTIGPWAIYQGSKPVIGPTLRTPILRFLADYAHGPRVARVCPSHLKPLRFKKKIRSRGALGKSRGRLVGDFANTSNAGHTYPGVRNPLRKSEVTKLFHV